MCDYCELGKTKQKQLDKFLVEENYQGDTNINSVLAYLEKKVLKKFTFIL